MSYTGLVRVAHGGEPGNAVEAAAGEHAQPVALGAPLDVALGTA